MTSIDYDYIGEILAILKRYNYTKFATTYTEHIMIAYGEILYVKYGVSFDFTKVEIIYMDGSAKGRRVAHVEFIDNVKLLEMLKNDGILIPEFIEKGMSI